MKHLFNKLSAFLVMLMCMSATVQAEELTQQSAEGTVGTLNGREAIVVDLGGSIGKVAIATQNVATYAFNDYNGEKYSFTDAHNFSLNGWYVPSKEEMEALMVRLTWNASKSGLWQGTKAGAEIDFGRTSLFLPAAGYDYDNQTYSPTSQCVYWTSTESGTGAYRLDMTSEAKEVKFGNKTIDTPIRPFCSLPEPTLPEPSMFSGTELQTPPSGLETEYYSVDGLSELAWWNTVVYSPLVAIDGNTMWVKNLVWYAIDVWVKGTIIGNQVVFEKGQYLGEGIDKYGTTYEHTYLAAWDSDKNIIDLAFDYDADAKRLYLNHIQFGGSCDQNGTHVEQVDGDDEWNTHGWTLQGTGTAGLQTGTSEEPEDDGHPSSANGTPAPVNFDLTTEDGLVPFTIVDANKDGMTWKWSSGNNCVWYYTNQYFNANDWLITPAVLLEAGKTYQMIVNASPQIPNVRERMELAYGVAPTARAMRNNILEPIVVSFYQATNESYMVTVQETGDYYFGVHCISDRDKYALRVYNISVIEDVNITANENPDEPGVYYTTYYDGNVAHTLSDGATAYTATISGDNLLLTPIEDGIIPKDEAVIIRSNSSNITLSLSNSTKEKNEENRLCGSATGTAGAPDGCYILSYGQNGLGFYRYKQGNTLAAHKAFLIIQHGAPAKAFRMVFSDGDVNAIQNVSANEISNSAIYNLNGVRLSKLQKGINILNGKKIIVQ